MTPDEFTISESFLDVGDGHQLYVHDWGNPKAKTPIVFLHGGPGSQCKDKHKGVFDPHAHRVIFFDQRGCGRSLPYGSLHRNATTDVVEDIEKIARHFKLNKFILTGGSWGSALALFYALKYPKRVKVLVINGVWTCSKEENSWVDQGGFKKFRPDIWEKYVATAPKEFAHNPSQYHFKRILGNNPAEAKESAYAYSNMEGAVLALDDRFTPEPKEEFDLNGTIIEIHYLANGCFVPERHILNNAHKLKMPVWMVQGRYDMVCPPSTAYELSKKLPNGKLIWAIGGHKSEHESWNLQRNILMQITEG